MSPRSRTTAAARPRSAGCKCDRSLVAWIKNPSSVADFSSVLAIIRDRVDQKPAIRGGLFKKTRSTMARYRGATCKLARREGADLSLKSPARALDSKCKLENKPGQH